MNNSSIISIKPLGFMWPVSNPFLFCVHHFDEYPVGNEDMAPEKSLLRGRQIGSDFTIKDGWRMRSEERRVGIVGSSGCESLK